MSHSVTRRSLFYTAGALLASGRARAISPPAWASATDQACIRLNLNESAWGPSPNVAPALESALKEISRYGEPSAAQALVEQIAVYERVPPEQVVLGEILAQLGLYLGSQGGPGGEFLYSTPGYLALVDAASHAGGVGVGVPLNAALENDLPALAARITSRTRAIYLINPHNPTGTVSDSAVLHSFLRTASSRTTVIVDEAYLEYNDDFARRSAISHVRDGAEVIVFRTFVKIHGLAGLPIGYAIVPRKIGAFLREQGLGDAELLGRINMAAASAALADQTHVAQVRTEVARERSKWNTVLDELKLQHADSRASFVFFRTGRPHDEVASAFLRNNIEIARAFPPYDNWARITLGLPEENLRAQQVLRELVTRDLPNRSQGFSSCPISDLTMMRVTGI